MWGMATLLVISRFMCPNLVVGDIIAEGKRRTPLCVGIGHNRRWADTPRHDESSAYGDHGSPREP